MLPRQLNLKGEILSAQFTAFQTHLRQQYGPWALVTGASEGIGREMALALAEAGLNLVLVARRQSLLEQLATELGAHGIQTRVVAADLAQPAGTDAVLREASDLEVGLLVAASGMVAGSLAPQVLSTGREKPAAGPL